jgi:hypothetical protein
LFRKWLYATTPRWQILKHSYYINNYKLNNSTNPGTLIFFLIASSLSIMRFTSIRLSLWLVGLLVGLSGQRAVAQVAAPSQGGGVDILEVTATTMKVRFGMNGTGEGRVLAVAPMPDGAPVPLAATNGQFYTASPTYGQGSTLGVGYAVYSGKEYSAIITGLKPNTRYYVTNAEYNTDGTTIAYNTSGTSMSMPTSRRLLRALSMRKILPRYTGPRPLSATPTILRWNARWMVTPLPKLAS